MAATIKVVKGSVVVEGVLADEQHADVIRRCKGRSQLELWRGQYRDLEFLELVAGLEGLSVVSSRIADPSALARLPGLRCLFLNGARIDAGFGFLAHLAQVEELSLLNLRGALELPDLSDLTALRRFRVWGCKGFADAASLATLPNLEELELVDTGFERDPEVLEPLVAKPSLRYVSATFGAKSRNDRFDALLAKHGKSRYGPS